MRQLCAAGEKLVAHVYCKVLVDFACSWRSDSANVSPVTKSVVVMSAGSVSVIVS